MIWRRADEAEGARDQLSAACIEVVARNGYRRSTVEQICACAGVDRSTFESYFEDLEDCFCQVFEQLGSNFLAEMATVFASQGTWREQLREIAYYFLDYLEADHPRARITVVEVLFAGERAQLLRDNVFAALYAFIDLGRQELADPDSLSPAMATRVGGAIFAQMRMAVEKGEFDALPRLVPDLMYNAVLPYLGPEVALQERRICRRRSAVLLDRQPLPG